MVIDSKGSTTLASSSNLSSAQTVSITSDGLVDLDADDSDTNNTNLADAADVTLAGAGSIKLDDIDTLGKDHDVLIDASELGGGLTIGDIKSDQKVDLDVKDVLGDITVGAITGKDVEIDAGNALGTLLIGDDDTTNADITAQIV